MFIPTWKFGVVSALALFIQFTTFLELASGSDASLPTGVKAVWDLEKAYREQTPTRERLCLNGLWRWQPALDATETVPPDRWGYFKVPGFWPGESNYIQEDCQSVFPDPTWKDTQFRSVTATWYQREIKVPAEWAGRRISLSAEYVNSFAVVFVDGKRVGEIRFPSGEFDLTSACRPGVKHVLSLLVLAMPLKGVMLSYTDTNSAKEMRGSVERRGLCGDVYLVSTPAAARITDLSIDTSVRQSELTLSVAIDGLTPDWTCSLRAMISRQGRKIHEFASKPFRARDLRNGRLTVTEPWKPGELWDIDTPQNMFDLELSLVDASGKLLDRIHPVRFGYREFWIDGRDFYLNGTRIYLSAVPLDNAQLGARAASYECARETMDRLRSFGINFVYTHNYGCEPGSHVSFSEVLRAADDAGMLVAFSQPHFGHYDWKGTDADQTNGYARHAEFYVRAARNHPSVVAYSMNHNATGYSEDMNPDMIDGARDPRDDTWSQRNAGLALRAESIVKSLDPSRIVYHHSSGNLGSMHTVNFYANFVPIQEMSDWFEHWATSGVKPVFLCEYGVPFSWDWTMYRGWYKGERAFGSARVPWEFCLAEWNAQFMGDRAYRISEMERKNLRFEARQFKAGNLWHRWDYPHHVGSRDFDEREDVFARYITDNWRAHRTWGLSANSPWEYQVFWKLRDGLDRGRIDLSKKVDWEHLQRPGFSPDYTQRQNWQMNTDFEKSDWVPTAAARALYRNNRPLLAYIGGESGAFTSKSHNFRPGDRVEKQLVIINNSRRTISSDCTWSLSIPRPMAGSRKVTVRTGEQERIPLQFDLPSTLEAGHYRLSAAFQFDNGESQTDDFSIDVLPRPTEAVVGPKFAMLDPKGETSSLLAGLKVGFDAVDWATDTKGYDVLVIGKGAMTKDGPGPNVDRVRDGLKVVVFEQSSEVLEGRFGFRVEEYGLREVFRRLPDHPILAGLDESLLRDWRGEATLLPPQLQYSLRPRFGPTVKWCGIDVPRIWRRGCRGNVASVLIEKPAKGDFLSIVDGGYALQFTPLAEYREGKGMVLFCQMDVTARTEPDPAADALVRNIIQYVTTWKPPSRRTAVYAGEPAGRSHLESAGLSLEPYSIDRLTTDRVLIAGPGCREKVVGDATAIQQWLRAGGNLLAVGLDGAEAGALLGSGVIAKQEEHIAAYFEPFGVKSLLAGIGPADVHNRDPRQLPLIAKGATVVGNGILAQAENANVVFCQLVPWQFEYDKQMNLKRTFRNASRLVTRLAANMGVDGSTPILTRFHSPPQAAEKRWLTGLYLDVPEEWDDPYRFFRW